LADRLGRTAAVASLELSDLRKTAVLVCAIN